MTNNTRIKITDINARTESRVIGSHPEHADMGNPNGNYYGDFGYLEARTADGAVMVLTGYSKDMNEEGSADALTQMVARIIVAGTIDPNLWHHDRWSYGSGEFADEMIADEIQDARRDGERHPLDR